MTLFDATSRERCTIQRSRTNTPLQALALLNDPVVVEMAKAFTRRVFDRCPGKRVVERVQTMFALALNRSPSEAESERCTDFVAGELAAGQDEQIVWFHLAAAVLNLDETISIE